MGQFYVPVGAQRVNIDKMSCKFCTCLLFLFAALYPIAFCGGWYIAPSPLEYYVQSKGHGWNQFRGILPGQDDTIDHVNQRYTFKLRLQNRAGHEDQGMEADVSVRVKMEGRHDKSDEWDELFDSTRTRRLTCESGEEYCQNLTLAFDPAPEYKEYRADVMVAEGRAHTYGFIKTGHYIFEVCRTHWTFYEGGLKLAFLILSFLFLYVFLDRVTRGEMCTPCLTCCCLGGGEDGPRTLLQPEQRFVGLLLLGLLCFNDWSFWLSLATGHWSCAILSDVLQVSFFFLLLLSAAVLCHEAHRPSRVRCNSPRGYALKVAAVAVLWALEVAWIVYVGAKVHEDATYDPRLDDEAMFYGVQGAVVGGGIVLLLLSLFLGCYNLGAAESKPMVYTQWQDKYWGYDRQGRATFFWFATLLYVVGLCVDGALWMKAHASDTSWRNNLEAASLTSVLVYTNCYVILLAYGFMPVPEPRADEDMMSYLTKFHL